MENIEIKITAVTSHTRPSTIFSRCGGRQSNVSSQSNVFAGETFVKKAAFRLNENKTRAERYQVAEKDGL